MSDLKLTPSILAMYLGCKVFVPETNKTGTFEGINWVKEEDGSTLTVIIDVHYSHAKDDWDVLNENDDITRVKPVLRKLSSTTEEERLHLLNAPAHWAVTATLDSKTGMLEEVNAWEPGHLETMRTWWPNKMSPEHFKYLLSKHFDLFGLIDAGLAIEKQ